MNTRRLTLTTLGILAAALVAPGCGRSSSTPPPAPAASGKSSITVPKPAGEPLVRVRVAEKVEELTITGPSRVQVCPDGKPELKTLYITPLNIRRVSGRWIGPWSGRSPAPDAILTVEPLGPTPLALGSTSYPGAIHLVPVAAASKSPALERFDAVNHVRLEAYLPGVLAREMYENWEPAAFLAQAIAARTYAIWSIMNTGPGRHFDMEAGEASQAYIGQTAHATSVRAVADTAGLVLTWNDRLFPAYYSSTCGGLAQSPTDAFGSPSTVPPLEPVSEHFCCAQTRHYSWGPIDIDRASLSRRVAAWGQSNGLPIARLGSITSMRVSHVNALGRPVRFEIADDRGQTFTLRAESVRFAVNFSDADLKIPPPPSAQRLKSSCVDVMVRGSQVHFFNGRGYGHGVGLCQYGVQNMAKSGKTPLEMLAFYYPGAKVERAY
jgi:stage II sporulation protein D